MYCFANLHAGAVIIRRAAAAAAAATAGVSPVQCTCGNS